MCEAGRALLHAVERAAGEPPVVVAQALGDWWSATFTGAHHRLTIRLPGGGAARLVRAAALDALDLHGHLLIDLAMTAGDGANEVRIEASTVEAA